MPRKTLTISFGEYDEDIYELLRAERNASALIRHLLRGYFNGEIVKNSYSRVEKSVEQVEDELSISKNRNEEENNEALMELDF